MYINLTRNFCDNADLLFFFFFTKDLKILICIANGKEVKQWSIARRCWHSNFEIPRASVVFYYYFYYYHYVFVYVVKVALWRTWLSMSRFPMLFVCMTLVCMPNRHTICMEILHKYSYVKSPVNINARN